MQPQEGEISECSASRTLLRVLIYSESQKQLQYKATYLQSSACSSRAWRERASWWPWYITRGPPLLHLICRCSLDLSNRKYSCCTDIRGVKPERDKIHNLSPYINYTVHLAKRYRTVPLTSILTLTEITRNEKARSSNKKYSKHPERLIPENVFIFVC